MLVILGASHGIIDAFSCFLKTKWKQTLTFLLDQAMHLACIIGMAKCSAFATGLEAYDTYIKIICVALIIVIPCSILVSKLLKDLYPDTEETGIFDVGSMIGIMERIMTVIFAVLGNYASIAIIITVKTWARSDDLKGEENKDFRNKYLLGTLSSLVMALLLGMVLIK